MPRDYQTGQSAETALLDMLPEPAYCTTVEGAILAWNPAAELRYGFPVTDALGRDVRQLLNTRSSATQEEIQAELLGAEGAWSGELQHVARAGTHIIVHSRKRLIRRPGAEDVIVSVDCDPVSSHSLHADQNPTAELTHEQLADVRSRFEFATQAAQIGYWYWDLPFDQLIWDARVKEHFFLPPDAQVDIQLFYRRLHPADRERTRRALEKSIQDRAEYNIEYRTVSPRGEIRWINAIGRTAYDSSGRPVRFDGVTFDVTRLKQAEAELRDSEAQLTSFIDAIPIMSWIASPDGWLEWYNQRWYDYTGTAPEDMKGWGWQSVHDPATLPTVLESWQRSLRTGEPWQLIFPLRGADGVFRSFLTRAIPIRNEQGEIVRWFGTNTEIDELHRTREALRRSEEHVRIALKDVPLLLYTTDTELRYTWMHRCHPAYRIEDILGHTDEEISEGGDWSEATNLKRAVLESGMPGHAEVRVSIRGRQEIYEMTVEPIHDPSGQVTGLTVAALDITDRRRAEETLRKTEKLAVVGRLASSIAHEINNPLEAVSNLLYLIRDSASTNSAVLDYVSTAEDELQHISQIVTHSLRFHRQSNAPRPEKLSPLAESACGLYQGRLKNSGARIIRQYRDSEPVLCFAGEIRQVLANFIGNAIDASPGGTIVVRVHPARDWRTGERCMRVTVSDNGSGISAATRARLFEPFVTTKEVHGTGLGLWVSAEILHRHHARLQVRSATRGPRRGTTFSILLPTSQMPAPGPEISLTTSA